MVRRLNERPPLLGQPDWFQRSRRALPPSKTNGIFLHQAQSRSEAGALFRNDFAIHHIESEASFERPCNG
jgi:hypothetical protein